MGHNVHIIIYPQHRNGLLLTVPQPRIFGLPKAKFFLIFGKTLSRHQNRRPFKPSGTKVGKRLIGLMEWITCGAGDNANLGA